MTEVTHSMIKVKYVFLALGPLTGSASIIQVVTEVTPFACQSLLYETCSRLRPPLAYVMEAELTKNKQNSIINHIAMCNIGNTNERTHIF